MKEADLRKWHRYLGISLATFIVLQAGTGMLLTVGEMGSSENHEHSDARVHDKGNTNIKQIGGDHHEGKSHDSVSSSLKAWNGMITTIHHGGGLAGIIYRMFLGAGLLLQTVLGTLIFLRVRRRTRRSR